MSAGHLVVAYHGCDAVVRDDLVSRRISHLSHSRNEYDWLGPGAYFFEGDSARALKFARASHEHPERLYTKEPILLPASVGVVLCVQHWLDMTTQEGLQEFALAHAAFIRLFDHKGVQHPENVRANDDDADILLRKLDNAVFTHLHEVRDEVPMLPYQAVRAAFPQGQPIAANSGFRFDTHIQIAVRDDTCILGWFYPDGEKPLSPTDYATAKADLEAARHRSRKPRKRAS
ncbi:hypothetical protein [Achromobacter sp. DH1f]|uniref:hypothetical protein n=1 Tax=Achromobacter sp. DH1f TaxID=1397275 RepID=UPI000468FEEB|nr:hypothetical protein [Achromobacter sp. DH1f]